MLSKLHDIRIISHICWYLNLGLAVKYTQLIYLYILIHVPTGIISSIKKLPAHIKDFNLYYYCYVISSACIIRNHMKNIIRARMQNIRPGLIITLGWMFLNTRPDVFIFKKWPAWNSEASGWGFKTFSWVLQKHSTGYLEIPGREFSEFNLCTSA